VIVLKAQTTAAPVTQPTLVIQLITVLHLRSTSSEQVRLVEVMGKHFVWDKQLAQAVDAAILLMLAMVGWTMEI
jgi:6-phosphofructokinase